MFGKVGDNIDEINPNGIGLGLTICNKILLQLGSKLEVASVEGEGTTFFFNIMMETKTVNGKDSPPTQDIYSYTIEN